MAKKIADTGRIVMTPQQFETMAVTIWGSEWRTPVLAYLGISYSQLHRYMTIYGGQTIPRPVALAMNYAHDCVNADKPVPVLAEFAASEAVPVKFVPTKKERPERVNNDAPEIDIFAETPAPEEKAPEPPPTAPEKPKKAPAKKPAPAKPAKATKAPAKPKEKPAAAPAKKAPPRRPPAKKD